MTAVVFTDYGWVPLGGTAVVAPPTNSLPTQPGSVGAVASGTTALVVTWTAASDPDGVISGYEVRANGVLKATVTALTYTITGLAQSTAYSVAVRAIDNTGAAGPDRIITASTGTPAGTSTWPPSNAWSGQPKPTPANTAVRTALTTHAGDLIISAAGSVISGLKINGSVWVNADNVTIRDCEIYGALYPSNNGAFPVKTNLQLEYCFIAGVYATGCDGVSFDHCRIGNQNEDFMDFTRYIYGANTLEAKNLIWTNCLIDRLTPKPAGESHLDGLQILGADNVILRNTVIDYTAPDQATKDQITTCFTMEANHLGHVSDTWELNQCWFYGGGYYQIAPHGTNGKIIDCKFSSVGGISPIYAYPGYPYVQSGNTLDGNPITLPTS